MKYEKILSHWFGARVTVIDDFETICKSDFDFIEILMILENSFLVNLLETEKVRQDFHTVRDFINWAESRPQLQKDRFRLNKRLLIPAY
ncbi:hypothetical protein RM549_13530 [Salegentibacter sp. F188]|uniref:Acyl carrier protein n=1 Tax=Autumnicola patrickiae TaxID=3075591 RepID=A0ABU3E493_9FLAO|nr:hypothetical protein [Salegentibacter sp. F188]MDT0690813.1 hypothetical protein [Salegentibacter sp. F188]